jgi:hypothetical protein
VSNNRWSLLVESDDGRKGGATLATRDEAFALAERVSAAVRARGVAGMDDPTE